MHNLSRQIGTFGLEGQVKISSARVLISGMGPLGIVSSSPHVPTKGPHLRAVQEVAKNVCLAGVSSLTIHDTRACTPQDLGGNFYLSQASVGLNRAEQTLPALRDLNPTVSVTMAPSVPLAQDLQSLESFNVVVATDMPLEEQKVLDEFCRSNKIKVPPSSVSLTQIR